ncbi:hypothetical protein [Corynebacterium liangguodongii]|uniref:Uncharacterized protein n=1 Tax=Corynebacterium liangguodongii TaxID=2079535 RepID=A0A2S0WC05_9CORY|nr:hypothetical protein [Corynebacterium liangguodongii]AWB83290.1 hypothetical protein C3E79_01320 [Corynebacterium liangguodongii]PWC00620.1 hypothetical protein DF219_01630 [Corynebacterium liangguodongii]
MFPTMVAGEGDPNRRPGTAGADQGAPGELRAAYWLAVVAAVLMLVTGMVLLSVGFPEGAAEEARAAFMRNMRVAAFGNIALAIGLAVSAPLVSARVRGARAWASVCIAGAIFLNVAAFFMRVTSWASFAVVIVLTLSLFFMFRPAVNAYHDRLGPWRS